LEFAGQLAVTSKGAPIFVGSSWGGSGNEGWYVHAWNGSEWEIHGRPIPNGEKAILALDNGDKPVVLRQETSGGFYRAYRVEDGDWVPITGPFNDYGSDIAFTVNLSNNSPTVAYVHDAYGNNPDPRVQFWDGGQWITVGGTGDLRGLGVPLTDLVTLAMTKQGFPVVTWLTQGEPAHPHVTVARWDGSRWRGGRFDNFGFPISSALAFDDNGHPLVGWAIEKPFQDRKGILPAAYIMYSNE
jgi:hypothetical protein